MTLQFWVSVGSLIAVVIGMISLANTLRQERLARETARKQESESRETARKEETAAREKEIAAHVKEWTELHNHIDQMQQAIDSINHTIGNGFAGSIKEQIKDLKDACNCKMVEIGNKVLVMNQQIEFNTPRITQLESKVNDLEKGK
jgi:predicted RNase H-like nuclease (RuvC/YqgF family)